MTPEEHYEAAFAAESSPVTASTPPMPHGDYDSSVETEWRVIWFDPALLPTQTKVGSERICRASFKRHAEWGHAPLLQKRTVTATPWETADA